MQTLDQASHCDVLSPNSHVDDWSNHFRHQHRCRYNIFRLNPFIEIEIQGLQWESMQDLLKLKVEMKQYQNINLTIGNLPSFPMVNMHMANDFTNDMKQKEFERRIFENINSILVLEDAFVLNRFKTPWSYDLLIIFSLFYLNEFRKSNIPNTFLFKNRPGLIFQTVVHGGCQNTSKWLWKR